MFCDDYVTKDSPFALTKVNHKGGRVHRGATAGGIVGFGRKNPNDVHSHPKRK